MKTQLINASRAVGRTTSKPTTFRLRAADFNKLRLLALEKSLISGSNVSVSALVRDAIGEKYGVEPLIRISRKSAFDNKQSK